MFGSKISSILAKPSLSICKFLDDPNITRVEHYMSVLTDVMMCDDFSNIDKRRKSLELKGWANTIAEEAISKCYDAIKAFNEEA